MKLMALTAMTLPALDYARTVWDAHVKVDIEEDEQVQKLGLYCIYNHGS